MRPGRWIWFLLSIALGVAGGLMYGWLVNPVQYVNTTPDSLRDDYKADYALMVAEIYEAEQNIELAESRMLLLSDDQGVRIVRRAILTAQELNYSSRDLELLGRLSVALEALESAAEVKQP
ncbi:MAG: hypothetical protein U1B80_00055 [Anaerolineaceae bacterium]|nr:hypothetical protein [Anaerolineaceae bacterium]